MTVWGSCFWAAAMQEAHDPYGALRRPDYRRLLIGGVLFTIGTEIQAVAVGWELYQRTGSPLALGLTGLAQFLPVLLLALPAGHTADRFDCKKVLLAAQGLGMVTSLVLAALSFWQAPVYLTYVCLLVVGVARAFSVPARWALLPRMIPLELLPNAVTWNSSGFQVANVTGPALGGYALSLMAPGGAYLITACCALCCVGLVSTIRAQHVAHHREPPSLETLLAGLRFVWRSKAILSTISLDLFAVLLGGATALLPVYARDILLVDENGFGWLRAAPALARSLPPSSWLITRRSITPARFCWSPSPASGRPPSFLACPKTFACPLPC